MLHYSIPNVQQFGAGGVEPTATIDSSKTAIDRPLLLVSKLNPRKGTIALARPHQTLATLASSEFIAMEPRDCILEFARYFYLSVHVRLELSARVESATRSHQRCSPEDISKLPVYWPSISEQTAIAAFLDRETAKIDRLVDRKGRLIELLQQKRAALITRAVTRGLDPNAPMKDFGVEWLGEIPAHWEVKRLRHIVRHIEQGWSPDCENREAGADEWGVLKAGCVNRGRFLESEHKALPSTLSPIPALEIRKGDLLMSRASGSRDLVGSVAVVSECRPHLLLCDKVFRLHTESSAGHRQFIGYAMNSRIVRWQIESVISGGSGLASNISQEAVKDLVVVQPPRSERWEIAGYLDCETAKIDALIAKVRQAIHHLKEFRTALISAAVTGKIDVREEAS